MHSLYAAGGEQPAGLSLCADQYLVLDGVVVDSVRLVVDVCPDVEDDETLFQTLRSWKTMLDHHNANTREGGEGARLIETDEFVDTLGGDALRVWTVLTRYIGSPPPEYSRPRDAGRRFRPLDRGWWQMSVQQESQPPEAWKHHLDGVVRRTTRRSRFFITDWGRTGLGPAGLIPSDVVFVARGGELPLILRSASTGASGIGVPNCVHNGPPLCSLVGPAYVSGVMDGEALADANDALMSVHIG